MHLPSRRVCLLIQPERSRAVHGCVITLKCWILFFFSFQATLEISLNAYLVFQPRQYLSGRLTLPPVWFLINFISAPRQGRSSMIHTLFCSSLRCKCIQKKKTPLVWQSNKSVYQALLCFHAEMLLRCRISVFVSPLANEKWKKNHLLYLSVLL